MILTLSFSTDFQRICYLPATWTAMPKLKLSKRVIEETAPAKQDVILWDDAVRGFACKVTSAGKRVYFVYYRTQTGQQRRPTIGVHGAITVDQARTQAQAILGAVAKGEDPSGDRQVKRGVGSIGDLTKRYLKDHARLHKKPSSIKSDESIIRANILPALGSMNVASARSADIERFKARFSARPYAGNRAIALLSKMFNCAELWGLRPKGSNPCRGIVKFRELRRDRHLTEVELKQLGAALDAYKQQYSKSSAAAEVISFLALTGLRLGEAISLKWEFVDLELGVIKLSDAKAGARVSYIGTSAIRLLRRLPRSGVHIFPNPHRDQPVSIWTVEDAWKRIRNAAGVSDVRIHDLRHLYGTVAGASGHNAFIVRDLLGHRTLAMTNRYVGQSIAPLTTAANQVSQAIEIALSPGAPKRSTTRRKV